MKSIKPWLILLILIGANNSFSQLGRYDSIPVIFAGDTLRNPWAGGLNSPQFSQIDLNGDGIKDLFAFERNWDGRVKTFLNNGSVGVVDYSYAQEYQSVFPEMRNWSLLADFNCDGKEDIFTYVPAGIAVYRNDYNAQDGLQFTLVSSLLSTMTTSGQTNLNVPSTDIPAIIDVDGDGDLDILTFGGDGSTVEYHKNLSIENYGNCDNLEFELEDQCWGQFQEDGLSNDITLGISCKTGKGTGNVGLGGMHSGSSLLALDIDGDMDMEVLIGDISFNNMVLLINGGTPANANFVAQDPAFPTNTTAVEITVFPAGYHLDVNNDGEKDLLVATNNALASENFTSVWYYENTGLSTNQPFEYQQNDFLQDEMIELGAGANPVFFDYNSDGLEDLLVGNESYYDNGNNTGKLALFKNVGSANYPAFDLITRDYINASTLGKRGLYPTFGDLDGDGDTDMVLGDAEGELHYFDNTAGSGNTVNLVLAEANYKGIDVGQNATPQLVDINKDGKLDLLIGERGGRLRYHENFGTTLSPNFSSVATNDFFGGIDMLDDCCTGYSAPFMSVDSASSSLLFVASELGYIYKYNNIDSNLAGSFSLVDSFNTKSYRVSISGKDINSDGEPEIAIGEHYGGLSIYKQVEIIIAVEQKPNVNIDFKIFPNPVVGSVTIEPKSGDLDLISVELISAMGKVIKTIDW